MRHDPSGMNQTDIVIGIISAIDKNLADGTINYLLYLITGRNFDDYGYISDIQDYHLGKVIGDIISFAIGAGIAIEGIVDIIVAMSAGAIGGLGTGGVATAAGVAISAAIAVNVVVGAAVAVVAMGNFSSDYAAYSALNVNWTNHGNKHVPPPNVSWKDIIKSTKHGPAMYHPDINIEALERMVWKKGTPVTNGKSWKVMELDQVIGANSGVETRYVRVEMSSNTIHGHPITYDEFKKLLKPR